MKTNQLYFGRMTEAGHVAVFHENGRPATRLDANLYPVGSVLSVRHEHPEGVVLRLEDAKRLGLEIEKLMGRDR